MSLPSGSSSSGASGIFLGSTVPHHDTIVQTLERQIVVRQEEIDGLKWKVLSLEADILIKQEALARIAVLEQENNLLRKIVTEKEKWQEQATELSLENNRLRQTKDDLVMQNLRQRQIIAENEEKMSLMARMLDLVNTELHQERENKLRLKRKLQILSSPEETPERHGRFKRQALKDCSRCHAEVSTTAVCRFHPKPPVKLNGSFHFPCCGKSGKSEPEGCHREGQHIVVFAT